MRPRPGRTTPGSADPPAAKRERHARTVTTVTPSRPAMRAFASPAAANNNARAQRTCRRGADRDAANASNLSRSVPLSTSAAAGRLTAQTIPNQIDKCETLRPASAGHDDRRLMAFAQQTVSLQG